MTKISYYETFCPDNGNWQKGSVGTYIRNPKETCSAEICHANPTTDLYIVKKINAPWDKDSNGKAVSPSYSVCWKIGDVAYGMGLPNDSGDCAALKKLI